MDGWIDACMYVFMHIMCDTFEYFVCFKAAACFLDPYTLHNIYGFLVGRCPGAHSRRFCAYHLLSLLSVTGPQSFYAQRAHIQQH
jgi:hypothetical protein